MNVLIFAAGLGTRLKPLTDTMPKALVPINGKPLLQHLIEKLQTYGLPLNVVVNIHHFGQQIIDFVNGNNQFGTTIQFSDERDMLLETGGGLKKAAPLFGNISSADSNPILIHNVDILSNINLAEFYNSHKESDAAATLLVSQRKTKRYLLFDKTRRLVGWTNIETGEMRSPYRNLKVEECSAYAFSGIHIVSPSLLPMLDSWEGKFSIIDFYLSVCDKTVIKADFRPDLKLLDVGKLDSIKQAECFFDE